MAKATVEHKNVQVNLSLNENELKLLTTVLGHVGGDPDDSPRKYSDDIYKAIRNLGLQLGDFDLELDQRSTRIGIFFK